MFTSSYPTFSRIILNRRPVLVEKYLNFHCSSPIYFTYAANDCLKNDTVDALTIQNKIYTTKMFTSRYATFFQDCRR